MEEMAQRDGGDDHMDMSVRVEGSVEAGPVTASPRNRSKSPAAEKIKSPVGGVIGGGIKNY